MSYRAGEPSTLMCNGCHMDQDRRIAPDMGSVVPHETMLRAQLLEQADGREIT